MINSHTHIIQKVVDSTELDEQINLLPTQNVEIYERKEATEERIVLRPCPW